MKRLAFNKRFVDFVNSDLQKGKIHTIRQSYDYWKRFEGKEVALFTWDGKPYQKGSKQKVFCVKKIVSVQEVELRFDKLGAYFSTYKGIVDARTLYKNDGFINLSDAYLWFCIGDYKPGKMAIIHFTDFKY